MTWTYNISSLSTSQLYQVRLLVGDTVSTNPQLQDEEITEILALQGGIYAAAAMCCQVIADQASSQTDLGLPGPIKFSFSQKATAYAKRAIALRMQSVIQDGGLPYCGGISITDKQNVEGDSDRVPPQFQIGMDDDLLPVSPTGNESNVEPGPQGP